MKQSVSTNNKSPVNKNTVAKTALNDVLSLLKSRPEGLTETEVIEQRNTYGLNSFQKSHNNAFHILISQFRNAIAYLLLVACVIAFATQDWTDAWVITFVLLANTLLGFSQEYKSEKTVEKLAKFVKRHVIVKRNGKNLVIEQEELVPGDIVIVKEGDIVPADLRLLAADDLSVNEGQLTGESIPISKDEKSHKKFPSDTLLFAGSVIEKGEGTGVVYAIGEQTELGNIARLSGSIEKTTQFEQSLKSLSTLLMKVAFFTIPFIFLIKLVFLHGNVSLADSLIFMFAFTIAVVPEALPVIVTITLATGALKLAKNHVVSKKLSAIEDLGNINLLCTDKTGTLTENKLKITEIVSENTELLQILALASDDLFENKRHKYVNSFDAAFEAFATEELKYQAKEYKKIKELPFDPKERRRWAILEHAKQKKYYLVEVGSAESLVKDSTHRNIAEVVKTIIEDGKQGLRHIAVTYKEIAYSEEKDILDYTQKPQFLGYAKIVDPLKPSAKETIKLAEQLGIAIKILTGDSKEVAGYVATEIGLMKAGEKVYTGEEIETMDHAALKTILSASHVFARVTPEQKYKIIKLLKEDYIVGYQGDGINDSPSLKLADVAIAVDTATDVAKESADIILLKRDLEVIIAGVKNGRSIFSNINKYIRYTMVGNFSSFFTLAFLYLIGKDLPLLPEQLLITSSFTQVPFIAIATDTVDKEELLTPNQYNMKSIMTVTFVLGLLTTIYQLFYYIVVLLRTNAIYAQTELFLLLTLIQLIIMLSVRNTNFFWKATKPSRSLFFAGTSTFIIVLALIYIPQLQAIFSFKTVPFSGVVLLFAVSLMYLFFIDISKKLYFQHFHK